MDGRIEELLCRFRIEPLDQLRRAFEVGKQHRHLFALAFEARPDSTDLLSQITGSVCQRRGTLRLLRHRLRGRGQRCIPVPHQHFTILING